MSCHDLAILSYDVQYAVVLVCCYKCFYLASTDYMFVALYVLKFWFFLSWNKFFSVPGLEMLSCIQAVKLTEVLVTSDWIKQSYSERMWNWVLTVALSAAVACRRPKPIDSIIDNEPSSGTNCCVELAPWLASCRGESKSASARSICTQSSSRLDEMDIQHPHALTSNP